MVCADTGRYAFSVVTLKQMLQREKKLVTQCGTCKLTLEL